jgi:hypothetical protein
MARRKHSIKDKAGNTLSHTNKNQSLLLKRDGTVGSIADKATLDSTDTSESIILSGDKGNLRSGELTEHNIAVLNTVKADVNHTHSEHYTKTQMDSTISGIESNASSEASTRAAGDSTLQTQVSTLDGTSTTHTASIATNTAAIAAINATPTYAPMTTSPTAPTSPNVGDQWWDTVYNALMIYIDDGDSTQWMDITTDIGDTMTLAEAEARYVKRAGDTMSGHLQPATDNVHDLGSPTKRWRDVYIGPGSLYIDGQKVIESVANTITITADDNQNLAIATKGTGDIEIQTSVGSIQMKSDVLMTVGKGFNTANGSPVPFHSGLDLKGETMQNLGDPVNATDASNKGHADGLMATEVTARTAAISAEASARSTAISAEASTRASAITSLQSDMSTNNTDIANLTTAMSTDSERLASVTALTTAFTAADTSLDGTLTAAIAGKANSDLSNVATLPSGVVTQLKGNTGNTGSQGPIGNTGAAGSNGATGSQGPIGNTGATGSQGPSGSNGSQGSTGASGNSVSVTTATSGTPSGGANGDLFFVIV